MGRMTARSNSVAWARPIAKPALTMLVWVTGLALFPAVASAAPFTPSDEAQVLATVPARANDPRARELAAMRRQLRNQPQDLNAAVALARRYFGQVAAEGDPRYIGYAQATLKAWWDMPEPPVPVRVLRAMLLQFDHRFTPALADLDAALRLEPNNLDAWAWRAAIHMVQGDYEQARRSCEQLAPLTTPLVAVACRAQVDGTTGQGDAAAKALTQAVQQHRGASADERLWALTRLAELQERRGDFVAAEAAFREALGLALPDVYLLGAYADFLLDRNRPAEVLTLLKGRESADVLLLRLAQAAQATKASNAASLAREMAARFDAARQRGDDTHRKEESRFMLAVQGDAARALVLAKENFAVQREPVDARILLEAALAAKQAAAAQPALQWMASSGIQSVALAPLARQLQGAMK
jgi:Flp pilus assembly protein TadD